jgi:glycosyltransferase involved in cell wall biosynthesis
VRAAPAPRALRILQVATADVRGGAEQVAWNLFDTYRARGHESRLAVGEKHTSDPDVWLIPNDAVRGPWADFWRRLAASLQPAAASGRTARALARMAGVLAEPGKTLDYYSGREDFRFPATRRLLALTDERPDLVHAHNLHGGYFDLRVLPWLSRQVPLILTLHDAWLLSGHCAHSFDCERWRTGCGQCPDLSIYPAVRRDATSYNWRRKRSIFARSHLQVATPSRWLMDKVEHSMLAPGMREARVIPNGVDLSVFRPGDRRRARAALDLPPDEPVLLTTGVDMHRSRWKDFPTLREAVAHLAGQAAETRITVLVLGTAGAGMSLGQARLRFVPYEHDLATVALYHQAADVYVHAARADTFPTAVLEALACGTPVVASRVGGIPEQVEDGTCGFLVPVGDARALAARVQLLLGEEGLRARLGAQGEERARRRFNYERQVAAYLEWYAELADGIARPMAAPDPLGGSSELEAQARG